MLSFVVVMQRKLTVVVVYIRILFFGPRLMYSYFSADFSRGGSRILFRRGCTRLLLYFNTNRPHSFFFSQNTSCILYIVFIQPTIDNAPDRICLHIGTNDLKSKAPDDIANAIVDLAKTIQSTCGAEVVLSELTTRKDAHKESVKSVNKLLIKYSKQHQWSLVRHSNITEKVLNRGSGRVFSGFGI